MIGETINNRYQIKDQLGKGGMGVVYRAFDQNLQRDVAIKVLSSDRLGSESRERFLREAQLTAQLDHPNIVTVFDFGEFEDSPFIVMQLVEGQTLANKQFDSVEEILEIAKQVSAALAHAHGYNIIHRDLKPENIIIDASRHLRLMDFGLARSIASRMTSDGALLGTVFYMAPEQIRGETIGPQTDLYALGVLLYELCTGKLPFYDQNMVAVLTLHLHSLPIPPRARKDSIPQGLNDLILTLMEKDPDKRPKSAKVVLDQLDLPELFSPTVSEPAASDIARIDHGRIFGRNNEIQTAHQCWKKTVSGRGQTVLISGEPGIGKTRLIKEIITHAQVTGGRALIGKSFAEGGVPYDVFSQIFRSVLAQNLANGQQNLDFPPQILGELLKLTPDLLIQFPEVKITPELDPEAEQRRLVESFVTFCKGLCAHRPLLLVLEDIHWADAGTFTLFLHLARRLRQSPVMLITAYRDIEMAERTSFNRVLLDLTRERIATHLKLSLLKMDGTRDILISLLQSKDIPDEFLNQIFQETEGNPFFIEEVVKSLVENKQIFFEEGSWHRDEDLQALEIPQGIQMTIQARLDRLEDLTKTILTHAAVIGREFDFKTLSLVYPENEDDLIAGLEEGLKTQLIHELKMKGGERFEFAHALVPASIQAGLSGLRRGRIHRKVGQVISEIHPNDFPSLAYHYSEAGDEVRGLEYTLKAAAQAQRSYAHEDALKYYAQALSKGENDEAKHFEILKQRTEAFFTIGDYDLAQKDIRKMHDLADKFDDRSLKAEAFITESILGQKTQRITLLQESGKKAEKIAETLNDPELLARALQMVGSGYWFLNDFSNMIDSLTSAIQYFKDCRMLKETAASLSMLGLAYRRLLQPEDALQVTKEALEISSQENNPVEEINSLRRLGLIYGDLRQYDMAESYYSQSISKAVEIGANSLAIDGNLSLAFLLIIQNRYLEAAKKYHKVLDIAWEIEEQISIYDSLSQIFLTGYIIPGDYQTGWDFFTGQVSKAEKMGLHRTRGVAIMVEGYFLSIIGQYDRAIEKFLQFPEVKDVVQPVQWNQNDARLAVAYAENGDYKAAFDIWNPVFQDRIGRTEDQEENSDLLEIQAYLTLIEGDPVKLPIALGQAQRSVELLKQEGILIEQFLAEKLFITALLHLAAGSPSDALKCSQEMVDLMDKGSTGYFPERFYFTHAKVLHALGEEEKANEFLKKAYDWVMYIASGFTDPDFITSWLTKQYWTKQIVTAAHRYGIVAQ